MQTAFRVSLGANLVLIALVAALLWRDRPPVHAPASPLEQPSSARPGSPAPHEASGESEAPAAGLHRTRAALAQLEALGISRETIATALLGEFHRRWDTHFAELEKRHAPGQVPERAYIELARLRDAAEVRTLTETLGEEGYHAWDRERTLRMLNAGGIAMTEAEAEKAYRLQKEFDEQYKARQMAMEDGVADAADLSSLDAQAREVLDRELEHLLGKERLAGMRGISDPVADVYRLYGDLAPGPGQAQAVLRTEEDYRVQEAALARRLRESPKETESLTVELQAMSEARDENLRQIFGAAAYDAVKRRNDPTYKTLEHFAEAWDLKDHEIQSVYEPLRAFHDQAQRLRTAAAMNEAAGQRVDWHEINLTIEQARQQTAAGLQHLIGERRLGRLQQNGMLTIR